MRKRKNKKLLVARNMPPSYHTIPGQKFDIKKSECVRWLLKRQLILNYLWDQIIQSGHIIYNPQTGKWQGVDYVED